jgi:hypothetical protein
LPVLRLIRVLTAVLGTALATALVPLSGAYADAPPPTAWVGNGPTGTVVSDGTTSAPQFHYDLNPAGLDVVNTWSFTTTAAADGSIDLPYQYTGSHAFFKVTVFLTAIVVHDGVTTETPLVNDGPTDCCVPPSQRFSYTGKVHLDVAQGDTYGFTFGGSNHDINNFLRGTLNVPIVAFTDADAVAQNTSWTTAQLLTAAGANGTLSQPGEARWYKFPVVPSSQVQVQLSNLAANYDLTLYSDIGQKFTELSSTQDLNRVNQEQVGNAFAPSIYSPSIYSPSIYSPSIYSPSIYSPSIYSPSIYSPSIYSPSIYSPSIYSPSIYSPSIYSPSIYSPSIYSPSDAFLQAFYGAQARSLIGVSAADGPADETIRAATWNNTGDFYVRVQGRDGASGSGFHLGLSVTGGPCTGAPLNTFAGEPTLTGTPGSARTVIVTDSSRLNLTTAGLGTDLSRLAAATDGVVVDVSGSQRVMDLARQADADTSCAYAKTLVAQGIRDIVNSYRDNSGTLKYVVLIGGDGVIPFFRYPDAAGLGPEQDYVPPVLDTSASQASLQTNDVLGQDAYGSAFDLSIKGSVLPVPDAAVGRLVETPAEIDGQIRQFLGLTDQTLPTPKSSLVTGYDFLTSAADSVEGDLHAGLGGAARNDQLITDQGVPTTTTTGPSGPSRSTSWTASDLSNALFGSRHDIVFLAGHFNANSTLAADYSTSLATTDVAAHPSAFTNSLVFSAGCHSGYNLVDGDGVPGVTLGLDWAQEMAQQKAILIAGTGYQYADTNFLAFSAKLYTLLAHDLRAGQAGQPVQIGNALVNAKLDYLNGLSTVTGIDQKTIIESAMYGLPMTGIDLPSGRTGAPNQPATITPTTVAAGAGSVLGLSSAELDLDTPTSAHSTPINDLNGAPTGASFSWLSGPAGVLTQPAIPTLPRQFADVTSTDDQSLRGVGFRSGSYTDTPGQIPLTGAPTTEQNGIHTTFGSPEFFPQSLFSVNYFDALGTNGSSGNTQLIVTPAQYRSDPGASTDTLRGYSHLGLRLFYSANTSTYGQNTPALAQAPSISQVSSTPGGGSVAVSAHVTGDPSAGIQDVWITYTAESGPLHGQWQSLDLAQDGTDSTLWSNSLQLPDGQDPASVRFLVQAVNGVGLVGVDNNLGALYVPGIDAGAGPGSDATPTQLTLDPIPANAGYGSTLTVGATLVGAPAGSTVTFDVGQGAVPATTDASGHATTTLTLQGTTGSYRVLANYAGDATHLPSSATSPPFTVTRASTALLLQTSRTQIVKVAGAKPPLSRLDTGLYAVLTANGDPLPRKAVLFTLTRRSTGEVYRFARTTDLAGRAVLGLIDINQGPYRVTVEFGTGASGTAVDQLYSPATTTPWTGTLSADTAIRV